MYHHHLEKPSEISIFNLARYFSSCLKKSGMICKNQGAQEKARSRRRGGGHLSILEHGVVEEIIVQCVHGGHRCGHLHKKERPHTTNLVESLSFTNQP